MREEETCFPPKRRKARGEEEMPRFLVGRGPVKPKSCSLNHNKDKGAILSDYRNWRQSEERGHHLEMACGQLPNAISEACVRLIVKEGDCRY